MKTILCTTSLQGDLDSHIAKAIEVVGLDPDEVHFSSAQTTAIGGQSGHFAALLVWRDPERNRHHLSD